MNKKKTKKQANFNTKKTIRRLWDFFGSSKKTFLVLVFLSFIAAVTKITFIYLLGYVYDKYLMDINTKWTLVFASFCYICIGLGIMALFSNLFYYLVVFLTMKISELNVCFNLRKNVFKKLQSLPVRYIDTNASGEIITRTSSDVENISMCISQYVMFNIYFAFVAVGIVITMFLINWALALISFIIIPFMMIVAYKLSKIMNPAFGRQQNAVGKLNAFTEERISGTKIVALYEKEELTKQEFSVVNKKLTKASLLGNLISNLFFPILYFFNNISFVILAALGISLVALGHIHTSWGIIPYSKAASLLIVYTMFTRNLTDPITQIVSSLGPISLALTSAHRIFEILDEKSEVNPNKPIKLRRIKGLIQAENMTFGYNSKKTVLKNINFVAKPNEVTAIVGPTGAGKTTIASLLTNFYPINSGHLKIDGHEIKNIDLTSLRDNVTMVLQDTFLFNVSIRENIKYGRTNASDNKIIEAAKLANAHHFIMQMPHGYDTILKNNATNLSQGQKQLLAIARAFLTNSRILILDEATSSIDTKTESDIQVAMLKLMKDKTTIIIAHRLSTIQKANNILVLKDGQIIEQGKHKQLIKKHGFYSELYYSQFKGKTI